MRIPIRTLVADSQLPQEVKEFVSRVYSAITLHPIRDSIDGVNRLRFKYMDYYINIDLIIDCLLDEDLIIYKHYYVDIVGHIGKINCISKTQNELKLLFNNLK